MSDPTERLNAALEGRLLDQARSEGGTLKDAPCVVCRIR